MSIHLIAGGAGFIGVNLARALLSEGNKVVAVDDLSRGTDETLAPLLRLQDFSFVKGDCSDPQQMFDIVSNMPGQVAEIWHMAANSDIPAGVEDYRVDLNRTFLTTVGILDVMKRCAISVLHFASSSAIYGDLGEQLIHEDIGPLQPISNYGAMKLASEAQIRAAVEAYLPKANIFRFPNVIGVPATHGVILDFVHKLRDTPDSLKVLGDGSQQKAYLHVHDLINAMLHIRRLEERFAVYNIGPTDDGVSVSSIAEGVRNRVNPNAEIIYGEGNRGWVGDVPRFRYSVQRLLGTGWKPKLGSQAAVNKAIEEIVSQEIS